VPSVDIVTPLRPGVAVVSCSACVPGKTLDFLAILRYRSSAAPDSKPIPAPDPMPPHLGTGTPLSDASVPEFLARVEHPGRGDDSKLLIDLMRRVTGVEPKMWGPAIIGSVRQVQVPPRKRPRRRNASSWIQPTHGSYRALPLLHASRSGYCTVPIMSKIGRYIATIIPPTTTPRTTIMRGSMAERSALTAASTSSS